ncbi:MAG: tRNA pseudouridine(38-40) synthase TruA [Cyclobacteriaceae bacterium]
MANWTHFYLIRIEFLGFRYHGWQKQPGYKSVHGMIDKTLLFILGHENFRTLGCSRTDAKVSADDYVFELFTLEEQISERLLLSLNRNLPPDIRAKSIEKTNADFNIIQSSKIKEYHYNFSFGEKSHPINAPTIRDFGSSLDIDLMAEAASVFLGIHNFKRYASKPAPNTDFERKIIQAEIVSNTRLKGNLVPANSYVFKVASKSFMRYQVRLMMGALVDIGRRSWSIEDLKESLQNFDGTQIKHVAPSSGLTLHRVDFGST